jgi:drug/metabolite transporter (DMT)-like permease
LEYSYQNDIAVENQSVTGITGETGKVEVVTKTAPKGNRFLVLLSLFSLYFIWGMTYLGMRIGLEGFPPFMLIGVRFLIAGAILYAVLRVRGAPRPTRSQWIGSAIIGILLLIGGNGGVVFAEQWVATGVAAVGIAAVPIWTALFVGLQGRWPSRREWIGLGIGFVGVILLNLGQGVWVNPMGAIALLIAPVCWALGFALSKTVSLPSGIMSSATEMLVAGVLLIFLSLGLHEHAPNLMVWQSLVALLFLILFGSLIAFSAYGYLLRNVRPALATSYAYVNPLVAVGLGVLFAGEQLTLIEVAAIAVILSGVALVTLGRARG